MFVRVPGLPRGLRSPLLALAAAAALLLGGLAAPAAAGTDAEKIAAAQALAAGGLIGANDWSCRPGAAHPRPVVLVHGTFANGTLNWVEVAPLLALRGFCVYALTYGAQPGVPVLRGIGPVARSAAELATFVDGVLAATGATEVDIVGHSQGGMMPRYYLSFLGGASKVDQLIGLAPSNHGTTLAGLALLAQAIPGAIDIVGTACPACADQVAGSPFLTALNAGGDTVAGVRYTVLATRYDLVVTPYRSQFLTGTGVRNRTVQDFCLLDFVDHAGIAFDPVALHEVLNVLDPAHATPTGCRLLP